MEGIEDIVKRDMELLEHIKGECSKLFHGNNKATLLSALTIAFIGACTTAPGGGGNKLMRELTKIVHGMTEDLIETQIKADGIPPDIKELLEEELKGLKVTRELRDKLDS